MISNLVSVEILDWECSLLMRMREVQVNKPIIEQQMKTKRLQHQSMMMKMKKRMTMLEVLLERLIPLV